MKPYYQGLVSIRDLKGSIARKITVETKARRRLNCSQVKGCILLGSYVETEAYCLLELRGGVVGLRQHEGQQGEPATLGTLKGGD